MTHPAADNPVSEIHDFDIPTANVHYMHKAGTPTVFGYFPEHYAEDKYRRDFRPSETGHREWEFLSYNSARDLLESGSPVWLLTQSTSGPCWTRVESLGMIEIKLQSDILHGMHTPTSILMSVCLRTGYAECKADKHSSERFVMVGHRAVWNSTSKRFVTITGSLETDMWMDRHGVGTQEVWKLLGEEFARRVGKTIGQGSDSESYS